MNYSTVVFLINPKARAVQCRFNSGGALYTYKTLDPTIKKGDTVVVPSGVAPSGFKIVTVAETDVDVDPENPLQFKWIVGKVDLAAFEAVKAAEAAAIAKIREAETRRKREELAEKLLANAKAGGADFNEIINLMNNPQQALPASAE